MGMTRDERLCHGAVRRAIQRGDLTKPDCCESCGQNPGRGKDGRSLIQGHHADYSKPLDVEWLCAKCHKTHDLSALGESNGQAKLNPAMILSAKRLRAKGLIYREIAARFGVDRKTIMRAIKGEQWQHLEGQGND